MSKIWLPAENYVRRLSCFSKTFFCGFKLHWSLTSKRNFDKISAEKRSKFRFCAENFVPEIFSIRYKNISVYPVLILILIKKFINTVCPLMLNVFCSDSTHIHINCTHKQIPIHKNRKYFLPGFFRQPQHIENHFPLHEFYFPSPLFNHIRNHVIHVTSPSSL